MGKGIDAAHQFHPSKKPDRRRGDQDHQRGLQAFGQGIVKDQPVHHQCQQDDPEDETDAGEEPAYFRVAKGHARDCHDHIAHRRDEPCR